MPTQTRFFSLISAVLISNLFSVAYAQNAPSPSYTVPLPPELIQELGHEATLAINSPKITMEAQGTTRLEYSLPAELVGPKFPKLVFRTQGYSQTDFRIQGDHGHGTCTKPQQQTQVTCFIEYKNLDIDLKTVENHLKKSFVNPDEVRRRLMVAVRFEHDPVGILKY